MREWLFGWTQTPGIVSIWANHEGKAIIWQRNGVVVSAREEQFEPWLFAAHVVDIGAQNPPEGVNYTLLEGREDSLKYLVKSTDGKALERTILTNLKTRTGKAHENFEELNDYYREGPVEQYLMQTGQSYFSGMNFADLHRLQFDLETTALSGKAGRIFMIAVRDSTGFEKVLEAPTGADEAQMIRDLLQIIDERDPDVIENHNLFGFDLPFLEERAKALNIKLEMGRKPAPNRNLVKIGDGRMQRFTVAGRELLDTLDATWRVDFVVRAMPSHSLKEVAKYFGVAHEERVYLEGKKIWETYRHDPETVRKYALQDVQEVDDISKRLHNAPFALSKMAPRRYERVANAGTATGILEPLLIRAYLHAGRALPRSRRIDTGEAHIGGAVMLFASGVAHNVVKTDVASLYPSLIRTFKIGPEYDELGVFVNLVDQLTELRLMHKKSAKELPAGLEQGEHDSMQAAMKLVINSAYGYLGAGKLAWFADQFAADEITKRGREILKKVCEEIESRGTSLIKADTDGVYFCVPSNWDETLERKLVAEVGALIPEGITLEYEGRYSAMLSHEIKNYALLGYDSKLTMRGGALRSRKAEPFGEKWLTLAMRYLLEEKIPQIRESFLQTEAKIKNREIPISEIAVRAKVSKSSDKYAAAGRSEAVYEAMLASGIKSWKAGERISIYRSAKGWLVAPEEEQVEYIPYETAHYAKVLRDNFASRMSKAFSPEDWATLFRLDSQPSLFDPPVESIKPVLIN